MREQVGERAAPELLVALRKLTRSCRRPRSAESRSERLERILQMVRRFIEDERFPSRGDFGEKIAALRRRARQKAHKGEAPRVESRTDERRERGVRAGQGRYGDSCVYGQSGEVAARVGDAGKPRIADTDEVVSCEQEFHEARSLLKLVVLMVAEEARVDVVACEKLARVACIFGRNQRHFLENPHGAQRHVLKIADGRRREVERALCVPGFL